MSRLSGDIITARELAAAQDTQMPILAITAHVSTKGVRYDKRKYPYQCMCTCENRNPHYFMMTDEKAVVKRCDYRMNPPAS